MTNHMHTKSDDGDRERERERGRDAKNPIKNLQFSSQQNPKELDHR